jgi:CobQ/CobB/MinD/ParA nucleotide binding domain
MPRFDEAIHIACEHTSAWMAAAGPLAEAGKVVVVRDMLGRLRLVVERRVNSLTSLDSSLEAALGNFFGGPSLVAGEMIAPNAIFESTDRFLLEGVTVVERVLTTAEWTRSPLENTPPSPPRATLYGLKGGVGRSTALAAWSRHLADRGERVLVVDLDLESPGVSSSLMSRDSAPPFGILDWLVEDSVGNADDALVRGMVASSPIASGTRGNVMVAPTGRLGDESYMAKLARAYLDVPAADGARPFAVRLASMLDHLERIHKPTVVLLDSRAGIHDLAGIATTRLGATTFLFAVGTRETWDGYSTLLATWASRPDLAREIRDRIFVVAAQVPETDRDEYLARFRLASYDAFEKLYDPATPDFPDAFNFDIGAQDAPHYPLPIYWSRAFQAWDPLSTDVTADQHRAAFGEFLDKATDLVVGAGD